MWILGKKMKIKKNPGVQLIGKEKCDGTVKFATYSYFISYQTTLWAVWLRFLVDKSVHSDMME